MAIKLGKRPGRGFYTDGNQLILAVPAEEVDDYKIPDVELLNGPSAVDITFDLMPGGFGHVPGNEELSKGRQALDSTPIGEGKQTDSLTLTYAWVPEVPVGETHMDTTLVHGERYAFYRRSGVPHDTPVTAGQIFTAFEGECGRKAEQPHVTGEENQKIAKILELSEVIEGAVAA